MKIILYFVGGILFVLFVISIFYNSAPRDYGNCLSQASDQLSTITNQLTNKQITREDACVRGKNTELELSNCFDQVTNKDHIPGFVNSLLKNKFMHIDIQNKACKDYPKALIR